MLRRIVRTQPRFLNDLKDINKCKNLKTEKKINRYIFNEYQMQDFGGKKNLETYIHNQVENNLNISTIPKFIPYSNISTSSVKMNSVYETMKKTDFFVISAFNENLDHNSIIFRQISSHCNNLDVKFMMIKPILLQACLSSTDGNLDDFWLKRNMDLISDDLIEKLKFDKNSPKLITGIYFFNLKSSIEDVFLQKYMECQRLLGARFSIKAIGNTKNLKSALKNIASPWESNQNSKDLARILKEFASRGLVKSNKSHDGEGLYII